MLLEPTTLLTFGLTAAVIVISPGPDTVVILRHALAGGWPGGLSAVAGVQLGLLVHSVLAGLGISALIAASPTLFKALALLGALYLAWLGIRLLTAQTMSSVSDVGKPAGVWRAAREALLTNLLNPKVLILFLALYPNFIHAGRGSIALQIVGLSALLIGINIVWQVGLVLSADRARLWLSRPAVGRATRLCIGTAFTMFALVLAVEHVF
jgi:threonine/homoserine/homoserine lactone efflux protein